MQQGHRVGDRSSGSETVQYLFVAMGSRGKQFPNGIFDGGRMSISEQQAPIHNGNPECVGKKDKSEGRWAKVSSQHAELSFSPQAHLLFNAAGIFIMPGG